MRIGALAAVAGVSTKAVRFYEQAGVLPAPLRTSSGYRDYPPQAADRLAFVRDAQGAGLILAEIRGVLQVRDGRNPGEHAAALVEGHLRRVEERIAELAPLAQVLRQPRSRPRPRPADRDAIGVGSGRARRRSAMRPLTGEDEDPQRKDYPLGGIPVEYRGAQIPAPDQRRSYS